MFAAFVRELLLATLLTAEVAPVSRTYLDSDKFYFAEGGEVFFNRGDGPGRKLDGADLRTFRVFEFAAFNYEYASRLAVDRHGFFIAFTRVLFPGADTARVLAPYNNGQCAFLIIGNDKKLYAIRPEQAAVEIGEQAVAPAELKPCAMASPFGSPRYFCDARHVYYFGIDSMKGLSLVRLPGAKPRRFTASVTDPVQPTHWGKDEELVFSGHEPLSGADAKSFRYVGSGYGVDKTRVFYLHGRPGLIEGSDAASFTEVTSEDDAFDAMDKFHSYRNGRVVERTKR